MTRARRNKLTTTPTEPLPERIRQAIASDWTSLTTLDTLTGARGSDARRAVHDALGALRGEGAVLEERVTAAGVEVRLRALLAAPVEGAGAAVPAPHGEPDAAPVAVEPSAPAEGAQGPAAPEREPTDPHFVECPVCKADPGHPCKGDDTPHAARAADAEAWARVQEGLPPVPAPKEPGPSSRCAVCSAVYLGHAPADGHAFAPKPRGRPRVAERAPVAPIPGAATAVLPQGRQRRARGPIVAVGGGRVERAGDAGAPREWPPCIDCGEPDSGSCPEGRCRDCDLEHCAASGACRECLTWIVREDVAGPLVAQHRPGCSLATAEDWRPRDAAELASVRARREEAPTAEEHRAERAEPETSRGGSEAPRERCPSVWHDVQCAREAGHPCEDGRHHSAADWKDGIWTDEAAERWAQRDKKEPPPKPRRMRARVEGGTIVSYREPPPCRPPACHRDDIHEPARVRSFARPLCEAHRRWVEAAGGTVASAADVAALSAD